MTDTGWSEDNSRLFIDAGDVITPSRREQLDMVTGLVPAERDEALVAVDLACGAGGLSEALLERFPRSRVIALDGSPAMLEEAGARLKRFGDRVELRQFDLRERDWLWELPQAVRCVVSSLALHHLDDAEKQRLFAGLLPRLEPGGALLIVDIVDPVNKWAWKAYGAAWDQAVRQQSEETPRGAEAYEHFRHSGWNHYVTPDLEFDKPSRLVEQLLWLRDAGFSQVDCFWLRAGHAVYGGYR